MAPVFDEGGESAAFDAVGDVVDCFADDVVSTADGEGLFSKQKSVNCSFCLGRGEGGGGKGEGYHSVAGEFRIGLKDAVCGRVVSCCVHGIGTCLVEGGREPHIAGVPAGDGDFWHGGVISAVRGRGVSSSC